MKPVLPVYVRVPNMAAQLVHYKQSIAKEAVQGESVVKTTFGAEV